MASRSARKTPEGKSQPRTLHVRGLLDQFRAVGLQMPERAFAFVLGAGASRNSGIKTAGEFTRDWIDELHRRHPQHERIDRRAFESAEHLGIPSFDPADPAVSYPQIYHRRFSDDPAAGFAYLEHAMRSAEPSFGYSVLAQILSDTAHKVVVTTNFDNLVADALGLYTREFPLVCGHESLAGFVRVRPRRPMVVKIHNDLFLAPKSRPNEIARLTPAYKRALKELFEAYTPIFLGYGGNDGSLMGFLDTLPPSSVPGGLYWCYRAEDGEPREQIQRVVARQNGALVAIAGFDEFMAMLAEQLGYELRDQWVLQQAQARAARLVEQFTRLREAQAERERSMRDQVVELLNSGAGGGGQADASARKAPAASKPLPSAPPGHALTKSVLPQQIEDVAQALDAMSQRTAGAKSWWQWRDEAAAAPTPADQEAIFRAGVEALPNDPWMLDAFARFLGRQANRRADAEVLHKRALELGPKLAALHGNYANLLARIPGREIDAEREYALAFELDPVDVRRTVNHVGFRLATNVLAWLDTELMLDEARAHLLGQPPRALKLELEFYQYAHGSAELRARALDALRNLLRLGLRSPHWDFTRNFERAWNEGHPEALWLPRLADVINDREPLSSLDEWPAWRRSTASDSA